jgi:hypothetical protein
LRVAEVENASDKRAESRRGRAEIMVLMQLIAKVTLAEPIRMDVQTDIGHIVKMLAANKPDDFANLTFGIIAGQARIGLRVDLLVLCSAPSHSPAQRASVVSPHKQFYAL